MMRFPTMRFVHDVAQKNFCENSSGPKNLPEDFSGVAP